jgi:hypothetical protein
MSSFKEVMSTELSHVKADKTFYKELVALEQGFVHKKPEHIEFFGGTMTGVQVVRFTDHELNLFFGDLLMIDEGILETKLHNLKDINPDFNVSSDVFNLTCMWLIHCALTTPLLQERDREELAVRVALYLNYKFLTSILFNFFKFPANPDTAAATYAELSNRFILKAEGSWAGALRYRSVELVKPGSIWRETLEKMDDDLELVKMVNDAQGRIKSMIINIYSVFMTVHQQGKRINSSSALIEIDGEIKLRDKTKGLAVYTQYVKSVVTRHEEFFKQELFDVVVSVVHTASEHLLQDFMKWFCDNYLHLKGKRGDVVIDDIMEHAFEYLSHNTEILRKKEDIATIIKRIKGTYTSSRATDEKLMKIKDTVEELIKQGCKVKDPSMLAALRTAFCLYVVVRAFTMKHYQNS